MVVAGLVVLALGLHDPPDKTEPEAPASTQTPEQVRVSAAHGVNTLQPAGWNFSHPGGALRLTSPDKTIEVIASSPTSGRFVKLVRDDAVATFIKTYDAKIVGGAPGRIGTRRANLVEVLGKRDDGTEVRALIAAIATAKRTWLVQVFSNAAPPALRAAEAQRALRAMRFKR
jgi:hypothetical protein